MKSLYFIYRNHINVLNRRFHNSQFTIRNFVETTLYIKIYITFVQKEKRERGAYVHKRNLYDTSCHWLLVFNFSGSLIHENRLPVALLISIVPVSDCGEKKRGKKNGDMKYKNNAMHAITTCGIIYTAITDPLFNLVWCGLNVNTFNIAKCSNDRYYFYRYVQIILIERATSRMLFF